MANEIENVLHASARVNGLNAGAIVEASSGVVDASVVRQAPGDYLLTLTNGLAPSEAVCATSIEGAAGPAARRMTVLQASDTVFRILTFNAAEPAVAVDAVWSLSFFRAFTGP